MTGRRDIAHDGSLRGLRPRSRGEVGAMPRLETMTEPSSGAAIGPAQAYEAALRAAQAGDEVALSRLRRAAAGRRRCTQMINLAESDARRAALAKQEAR